VPDDAAQAVPDEPSPDEPSPDLAVGSFGDRGPWVVDLDGLVWLRGLDRVREQAHLQVPAWLETGRIPPLGRLSRVVLLVGTALATWWATDRRREATVRRRGMSRRLRSAFARLGPTYIKLGQILSSGEGMFPDELVAEFKKLRDRVPPEAFEDVRHVVEGELGRPLDEVFAHFEQRPIAAASIAQVHAAQLRSGEEVVVKVQRPNVATLVRKDIEAMAWLAPRLAGRIPVAALANPAALVELFTETIVEELDFRLEAENMLDLGRVLAATGQRAVIVPRPHPSLVTRRVLVMERLDGFAWDDVRSMKAAGVDTEAVLHATLVAFVEGAMLYGVFHGDLHGGNLSVRPDGRTVLMDFGITGRMSERKRLAFLFLLVASSSGDVMGQLRALRDLGAFPPDTDLDAVFRDLGLDRPPVDPTTLTADQLLSELQGLTKKLLEHGAHAPKELMLFVKNMMFLDGAIAVLAPDLDIIGEVEKVHLDIAARHGERLAADLGIDLSEVTFDAGALKTAMGVSPDVERLTYTDLRERRDEIRRRIEEHRRH